MGLGVLACVSLVIGSGLVQTTWGWEIWERFPYRVSFGLESREQYLARAIPVYPTLRYLDEHAPEGVEVLSIGNDYRLYTKARIFGLSGHPTTLQDLAPRGGDVEMARHLEARGYGYLLVNREVAKTPDAKRSLEDFMSGFLRQHADLEFAARGVLLYRLRPVADGPHVSK
jgi:hypothetical protein